MSNRIAGRSSIASMLANPLRRIIAPCRRIGFHASLVLAILSSTALGQIPCPGIQVKVLEIENSTGTIACALFEAPAGFPLEFMQFATNIVVIKIRDTKARCHFVDISAGTYAIGVIHDENMNGKLDTNWLGIPKEGYGFSNDAKGFVSAPSFEDASFEYDTGELDMTISLNY